MAYRRSNGKGRRKLQPAVMQMEFTIPQDESYIDLALAASILNRRGYKQQMTTWAVAQFELFATGRIVTGKLHLHNSWL